MDVHCWPCIQEYTTLTVPKVYVLTVLTRIYLEFIDPTTIVGEFIYFKTVLREIQNQTIWL